MKKGDKQCIYRPAFFGRILLSLSSILLHTTLLALVRSFAKQHSHYLKTKKLYFGFSQPKDFGTPKMSYQHADMTFFLLQGGKLFFQP